ncbi:MAG: hypothetical protein IMF14_09370 [Proteobacteria bacterium]|nr:hypothetical protein [Pseudomonadota bacterium]
MRNVLLACAMGSAFILSGCSDSATDNIESTITHALLNGTWVSVCVAEAPDSFKGIVKLNDGIGSTEVTKYSDDITCSNNATAQPVETFTYVIGGDVTVDGAVAGITTATKVDFTDTTAGSSTIGEIDYDIFAVSGLITLYVGDSDGANDGSTDALRPTTLSPTISFTKQ